VGTGERHVGRREGQSPPRATVELDLQCSSEKEARAVWAALSADEPDTMRGRVEGARLRIVVGPATLGSLRATCDDILACFQAARGAASGHAGAREGA
jgi:hypothetical protein